MAFSLTYQDYVSSQPAGAVDGGSEGGSGTSSLMSQEAWDNLSDTGKWNEVGNGIVLTPADPRYDDLAKELGVTNGRQIVGGPVDKSLPLDTTNFVDPNRVAKQGNLYFTPDENLTPKAQEQGGVADWFWPVAFIAGAVGGSALASAGVLSGTAVTGAEAGAAGGFTSGADIAGTAAAAGEAGGTAGAAGAAGGAPEVAGPPADLAPPPEVGPPADLAPPPEVGPPANLAPPPEVGPPADLAPPPEAPPPPTSSGIPADVVDHSLPDVVDHSVTSDGLINGVRGTANSLGTWYNNLSPASRLVLGQVISQGTRGIMGAAAQRQAQQASRESEERHRQDVIRRGQVPLLPPGTFTPKPPGG